MTPAELAAQCAKAIEGGWEHVQLVIAAVKGGAS